MAFQANQEMISVMRDLAKKILNSVDGLLRANQEILSCYEDVRETVGSHTQEIELIVLNLNRTLKQSSEIINEIPRKINEIKLLMAMEQQLIAEIKNREDHYGISNK